MKVIIDISFIPVPPSLLTAAIHRQHDQPIFGVSQESRHLVDEDRITRVTVFGKAKAVEDGEVDFDVTNWTSDLCRIGKNHQADQHDRRKPDCSGRHLISPAAVER